MKFKLAKIVKCNSEPEDTYEDGTHGYLIGESNVHFLKKGKIPIRLGLVTFIDPSREISTAFISNDRYSVIAKNLDVDYIFYKLNYANLIYIRYNIVPFLQKVGADFAFGLYKARITNNKYLGKYGKECYEKEQEDWEDENLPF